MAFITLKSSAVVSSAWRLPEWQLSVRPAVCVCVFHTQIITQLPLTWLHTSQWYSQEYSLSGWHQHLVHPHLSLDAPVMNVITVDADRHQFLLVLRSVDNQTVWKWAIVNQENRIYFFQILYKYICSYSKTLTENSGQQVVYEKEKASVPLGKAVARALLCSLLSSRFKQPAEMVCFEKHSLQHQHIPEADLRDAKLISPIHMWEPQLQHRSLTSW